MTGRPISEITKKDLEAIKVICFDCDGVTVEKGTRIVENKGEYCVKTNIITERMVEKLKELKKYFHVTFSSGRSMLYLSKMYGDVLWDNASLQAEIGTFILYRGVLIQNLIFSSYELEVIKNVRNKLNELKDRNDKVMGFEPKQFLTTLHCYEAVDDVNKIVAQCDPREEFYCWWNMEAYDIGPKRINKGTGLKKLGELLEIDTSQMMTVGNGINDVNMGKVAGIDVSTDKEHLVADFYVDGEQLGGEVLIERILEIMK